MDILVTGRHTDVADGFRRHVSDKLSRLERLDPRAMRVDVTVCREHNPRLSDQRDRVELTWQSRGPIVRAEAAAADPYAALDLAAAKLEERLRRAADRRHSRHAQANRQGLSRHRPGLTEPAADLRPDDPLPSGPVPVPLPAAGRIDDAARVDLAGSDQSAAGAVDQPSSNGELPPAVPTQGVAAVAAVAAEGVEQDVDVGEIDCQSGLLVREKVHAAVPMTVDEALHRMELIGHDFYLFADAETGVPSVVYRRRGYAYGVLRLAALQVSGDERPDSSDSPSRAGEVPAGRDSSPVRG